jgi:hypothetical protein
MSRVERKAAARELERRLHAMPLPDRGIPRQTDRGACRPYPADLGCHRLDYRRRTSLSYGVTLPVLAATKAALR